MTTAPLFCARVLHWITGSRSGGRRRTIAGLLIAGFGIAWTLDGAAPVAVADEPARERPFRSLAVGIGEDYASNRRTLDAARRDLEACRRAGASVLRISFSWSEMEPEPGRYDFTFWDKVVPMAVDEYGLRLIAYVCYTPEWASSEPKSEAVWTTPPKAVATFGRFVGELVGRYKSRIHSWEIWNEPDIPEFWTGSTKQYAALVAEGSRAVRRADPTAKVVLGGIARRPEFLRELLRDEGVSPLVDVVNCHSYFETWHDGTIEGLPNYLRLIAGIIDDHGHGQELWMAEVGYSSYRPKGSGQVSDRYQARHGFEHTRAYQAEALLRTIALIRSMDRVSLVTWYRINDLPAGQEVIGDVNNRHLGIVDLQGQPKPALEGFRRAAELFSQPLRPADDRVLATWPIASRAEVHAFEAADGSLTIVAWQRASVSGDGRRPAAGDQPPRPAEGITLTIPGRRLRTAPDAPALKVTDQVDGTTIRLDVTQDRTLVFRLIPN
jgi:hypothetical protein